MNKVADITIYRPCRHPGHHPPSMIVLTPGIYEHTCPACQKTQTIIVRPKPSMEA